MLNLFEYLDICLFVCQFRLENMPFTIFCLFSIATNTLLVIQNLKDSSFFFFDNLLEACLLILNWIIFPRKLKEVLNFAVAIKYTFEKHSPREALRFVLNPVG